MRHGVLGSVARSVLDNFPNKFDNAIKKKTILIHIQSHFGEKTVYSRPNSLLARLFVSVV